jgi:pimeloyl-ACP methyl ester carboxylesterase
MAFVDRTVNAGVSLAYRDFGGQGLPVLFLPGAGRSLVDAIPVAEGLVGRGHRVLAMDLRGHGFSDVGPWLWREVLADVRAVIAAAELSPVVVVGHSLGGIVAAMMAAQGECAAAVNLDGHGTGSADMYEGYTVHEASQLLRQLKELSGTGAPADPLPPDAVAAYRAQNEAECAAAGLDASAAEERFNRAIELAEDGSGLVRVSRIAPSLVGALEGLDLREVYRKACVPLQVWNATAPPTVPSGAPDWFGPFIDAYRRGLARQLRQLAEAYPLIEYEEIDSSHDLHLQQVDQVVDRVSAFLVRRGLGG